MTLKELQKKLIQEKFDVRGVQVYIRDGKGGCWHADNITIEDSGVYVALGDACNGGDDAQIREFSDENG